MTIRLGYGLITCQSHPDDLRSSQDLVDEALRLTVRAENLGLHSVWVSEHHHVDDGHLGALFPMLAAMAASTKSIQLGTGLLLAPLHEPLRIAEEAAVVDLISHGRLILGMGLGWRDEEFRVIGLDQSLRVSRLIDALAVLRCAGDGKPTRTGTDQKPIGRITPGSPRIGGPPLWIGALAEPGMVRAGQLADGFLATEVTPFELGAAAQVVRAAAAAAGRDPAQVAMGVHLPTLVTEAPWAEVRDRIRYPGWKYEDMEGQVGCEGPLRYPGPWGEGEEARLMDTSVVGTPEAVAKRIREYADSVGGNLTFVARSYLPGSGERSQMAALMHLADVQSLLAQ